VADTVFLSFKRKKFIVAGRSNRHCNPDYKSIVLKVKKIEGAEACPIYQNILAFP
jgi:hypothetical protein